MSTSPTHPTPPSSSPPSPHLLTYNEPSDPSPPLSPTTTSSPPSPLPSSSTSPPPSSSSSTSTSTSAPSTQPPETGASSPPLNLGSTLVAEHLLTDDEEVDDDDDGELIDHDSADEEVDDDDELDDDDDESKASDSDASDGSETSDTDASISSFSSTSTTATNVTSVPVRAKPKRSRAAAERTVNSAILSAHEQSLVKNSKFKSYTQALEQALLWFSRAREWADLITCLKSVKRTLEVDKYRKRFPIIPSSVNVTLAKRLAQCLNAALPDGVHLKTLEIYELIFSRIGSDLLVRDLALYSAGLFPLFRYASMRVRPRLLDLFETHLVPLGARLAPALSGVVLALLPGMDEPQAEGYSRVLRLLHRVRNATGNRPFMTAVWQVLLFCPPVRLAALNYLSTVLPRDPAQLAAHFLPLSNDTAIQGLISTLHDEDVLVVRAVLELLASHFPVAAYAGSTHAVVFDRVQMLELVVNAADVLVADNVSLKRRFFAWVLGSDATNDDDDTATPADDAALPAHALKFLVAALECMMGQTHTAAHLARMDSRSAIPLPKCHFTRDLFVRIAERAAHHPGGHGAGDPVELRGPSTIQLEAAKPFNILQRLLDHPVIKQSSLVECLHSTLIRYIFHYHQLHPNLGSDKAADPASADDDMLRITSDFYVLKAANSFYALVDLVPLWATLRGMLANASVDGAQCMHTLRLLDFAFDFLPFHLHLLAASATSASGANENEEAQQLLLLVEQLLDLIRQFANMQRHDYMIVALEFTRKIVQRVEVNRTGVHLPHHVMANLIQSFPTLLASFPKAVFRRWPELVSHYRGQTDFKPLFDLERGAWSDDDESSRKSEEDALKSVELVISLFNLLLSIHDRERDDDEHRRHRRSSSYTHSDDGSIGEYDSYDDDDEYYTDEEFEDDEDGHSDAPRYAPHLLVSRDPEHVRLYFEHVFALCMSPHPELACMGTDTWLVLCRNFPFLSTLSHTHLPSLASRLWVLLGPQYSHAHYRVAAFFRSVAVMSPRVVSRLVVDSMLRPESSVLFPRLASVSGSGRRLVSSSVSSPTSSLLDTSSVPVLRASTLWRQSARDELSRQQKDSLVFSRADSLSLAEAAHTRFATLWHILSELHDPNPSTGHSSSSRAFYYSRRALRDGLFAMLDALEDRRPTVRLLARSWLSHALSDIASLLNPLLVVLLDEKTHRHRTTNEYMAEYDADRILFAVRKISAMLVSDNVAFVQYASATPISPRVFELFMAPHGVADVAEPSLRAPKNYIELLVSVLLRFVAGQVPEPSAAQGGLSFFAATRLGRPHLSHCSEDFRQQNAAVQASCAECLETIFSFVHERVQGKQLAMFSHRSVLRSVLHAVEKRDSVMQLQLLVVLRLVVVSLSHSHLQHAHTLDPESLGEPPKKSRPHVPGAATVAEAIFTSRLFRQALLQGLTSQAASAAHRLIAKMQRERAKEEQDQGGSEEAEAEEEDESLSISPGVTTLPNWVQFVLTCLPHFGAALPNIIFDTVNAICSQLESLREASAGLNRLEQSDSRLVADVHAWMQHETTLLLDGLRGLFHFATLGTESYSLDDLDAGASSAPTPAMSRLTSPPPRFGLGLLGLASRKKTQLHRVRMPEEPPDAVPSRHSQLARLDPLEDLSLLHLPPHKRFVSRASLLGDSGGGAPSASPSAASAQSEEPPRTPTRSSTTKNPIKYIARAVGSAFSTREVVRTPQTEPLHTARATAFDLLQLVVDTLLSVWEQPPPALVASAASTTAARKPAAGAAPNGRISSVPEPSRLAESISLTSYPHLASSSAPPASALPSPESMQMLGLSGSGQGRFGGKKDVYGGSKFTVSSAEGWQARQERIRVQIREIIDPVMAFYPERTVQALAKSWASEMEIGLRVGKDMDREQRRAAAKAEARSRNRTKRSRRKKGSKTSSRRKKAQSPFAERLPTHRLTLRPRQIDCSRYGVILDLLSSLTSATPHYVVGSLVPSILATMKDSPRHRNPTALAAHAVAILGKSKPATPSSSDKPVERSITQSIPALEPRDCAELHFLETYVRNATLDEGSDATALLSAWPALRSLVRSSLQISTHPFTFIWLLGLVTQFAARLRLVASSSSRSAFGQSSRAQPIPKTVAKEIEDVAHQLLQACVMMVDRPLHFHATDATPSASSAKLRGGGGGSTCVVPLPSAIVVHVPPAQDEDAEFIPPSAPWLTSKSWLSRDSPRPSVPVKVREGERYSLSAAPSVLGRGGRSVAFVELNGSVAISLIALRVLANLMAPSVSALWLDRDQATTFVATMLPHIMVVFRESHVLQLPRVRAAAVLLSSFSVASFRFAMRAWRRQAWDHFLHAEFFRKDGPTLSHWRWVIGRVVSEDKEALRELLERCGSKSANPLNLNSLFASSGDAALRAAGLKRLAFVLHSGRRDQHSKHLPLMIEKLVEALRVPNEPRLHARVFFFLRVLIARVSPEHLGLIWPLVLTELIRVFQDHREPMLMLAACKFIDLALVLLPSQFYVYQWMFLIEAVGASAGVQEPDKVDDEEWVVLEEQGEGSVFHPYLQRFEAREHMLEQARHSSVPLSGTALTELTQKALLKADLAEDVVTKVKAAQSLQRPLLNVREIHDMAELIPFQRLVVRHLASKSVSAAAFRQADVEYVDEMLLFDFVELRL